MTKEHEYQFDWTENGLVLLDRINRQIQDGGGYALYKQEALLENMKFIYCKEACRLRQNIQNLKYNNYRKKKRVIEDKSEKHRRNDDGIVGF